LQEVLEFVASKIETVLGTAAARNCAFKLISLVGFNKVVMYMNKRITEFEEVVVI
jgi:hypothetical protein